MGANLRGATNADAADSHGASNGATAAEPAPRWLKTVRSAVALPAPAEAAASPLARAVGRVLRPNSSLVFARCCFTSPCCPDGPGVVVERALVDSGSSDCELREGLLRHLPALPVVARGVTYETSTGDEAYDAYEVVLTVNGQRCAAVLTVVPEERFQACAEEPCSDEALLGHMAIAALGLDVHCRSRSMQKALTVDAAGSIGPLPQGDLGHLHVASSRPYGFFPPLPATSVNVLAVPVGQLWTAYRHELKQLPPRWLPGTGCAMPVSLDSFEAEAQRAPSEVDLHGKPVVPVTYASCVFMSPLSPELRVSVNMALVDSGSSDCELREGFLDRLGRLPTVAEGVVYETVAGRHVFDSYEVLVAIGGRVCACAVTGVPEERFRPGAEDPASDEAVIGLAALSALDLVVTCGQRTVVSARP